jgi:hypothetical protein
MEFSIIVAIAMAFSALVISCIVAITKYPPVQLGRFRKHLAEMQLELADQRDLYEQLLTSHKRLASRNYMRAAREKKAEEKATDGNEMDDDEWRAMMNRKLGLGRIGLKD